MADLLWPGDERVGDGGAAGTMAATVELAAVLADPRPEETP